MELPQNSNFENADLIDELFKLEKELQAHRKAACNIEDDRQRLETLFLCNKAREVLETYQAFLVGPTQQQINKTREQLEMRLERLSQLLGGEHDEKSKTETSKTEEAGGAEERAS